MHPWIWNFFSGGPINLSMNNHSGNTVEFKSQYLKFLDRSGKDLKYEINYLYIIVNVCKQN